MSRIASNGSINVTVVDGLTYTGTTAPDGSLYVVVATGLALCGAIHPCGAWWVTVAPSGIHGVKAPDGSLYVSETPFTNGGTKVTVVSGALSGGGGTTGIPMGLLLALTYAA